MALTTRLRLPTPELDDPADGPDGYKDLADAIDFQAAIDDQGAFASRPVSTPAQPGIRGRYYFATDTGVLYRDNGTGWNSVGFVGPDTITNIELAPNSVTSIELGDNSVDSLALQDDAVQLRHMSNDSVGYMEMVDGVKPSHGAPSTAETLRALGTAPGTAAAGTHAPQHLPGGADPLVLVIPIVTHTSQLGASPVHGQRAAVRTGAGDIVFLTFDSVIGKWVSENWAHSFGDLSNMPVPAFPSYATRISDYDGMLTDTFSLGNYKAFYDAGLRLQCKLSAAVGGIIYGTGPYAPGGYMILGLNEFDSGTHHTYIGASPSPTLTLPGGTFLYYANTNWASVNAAPSRPFALASLYISAPSSSNIFFRAPTAQMRWISL